MFGKGIVNLRMLENNDLEVLETLIEWMLEKKKVWLATVTKTWGSSPRPVGSQLVLSSERDFMGSVSGGCVEEAVIETALECIEKSENKIIEFGGYSCVFRKKNRKIT